jgi:hypothetical protein
MSENARVSVLPYHRRVAVFAQLPVIDLRPLLAYDTGRLSSPAWPDPVAGREFIRKTGIVMDRRRGSIDGISGERAFCEASGLLKIDAGLPRSGRIIYRRLFCAGVSGRLEFGFSVSPSDEDLSQPHQLARNALQVRVRMGKDSRRCHFENAGDSLARQYFQLSTRTGREQTLYTDWEPWWISIGTPAVLTERHMPGEPHVEGQYLTRAYQVVPSWQLNVPSSWDPTKIRQQRGRLWRTHTEIEALRQVLRAWHAHRGHFNVDVLREYVAGTVSDLVKISNDGIENHDELLAFDCAFDPLVEPDILRSLRDEVLGRSKGLIRQLDQLVERTGNRSSITISGGHVHIGDKRGDVTVGAVISGNAQVSGGQFQGHGTQNVIDAWSEFARDTDLEVLVRGLQELRERLRSRASEPDHDIAIAELAHAETAAATNDGHALRQHLANAGMWALTAAQDLGIGVAAAAIAAALGVG